MEGVISMPRLARSSRWMRLAAPVVWFVVAGCSDTETPPSSVGPVGGVGTYVQTSFADRTSFYAMPFPSDARVRSDGKVDVAGFPNPDANDYAIKLITAFEKGVSGYARTAGVFFSLTNEIDTSSLPTHSIRRKRQRRQCA
ncbi:MAG: hypothetical protein U0165_17315 [Polyangiaceae bacterium]